MRPRLRSLWWTLICEAEGVQRSTVFTNLWNRVQDGTQKTIKLLDFGTITSRFKLLQIVSLTEVSLSMESFLSNGEDRTGFLLSDANLGLLFLNSSSPAFLQPEPVAWQLRVLSRLNHALLGFTLFGSTSCFNSSCTYFMSLAVRGLTSTYAPRGNKHIS